MKNYIGTKIIKAEPMTENAWRVYKWKALAKALTGKPSAEGYKIIYPDGYVSWSPKNVFEQAYRELSCSELTLINSSSCLVQEQTPDPREGKE